MVNGTILSSLILSNGRSTNETFINYHSLRGRIEGVPMATRPNRALFRTLGFISLKENQRLDSPSVFSVTEFYGGLESNFDTRISQVYDLLQHRDGLRAANKNESKSAGK